MANDLFTPMADPANDLAGFSIRKSRGRQPAIMAAAALWADAIGGRVPHYLIKEAMAPRTPAVVRAIESNYPGIIVVSETHTRSDFPSLTGDVLGRMALARYRDFPSPWRQFTKVTTNLQDFRPVKRIPMDGLQGTWPEQMEDEELEYGSLTEGAVSLTPRKYALGIRLSFELIMNDDLGAFDSIPNRLGVGGARTVNTAVTDAYVGPNGPDAAVYTVGNGNIITGNPALNINSLGAAYSQLLSMKDSQGQPIMIELAVLVVPPALAAVARNLVNAITIRMTTGAGASGQELEATNWLGQNLSMAVDPYIPLIATTANGNTSWFLFASPATGSAAIEAAFVAGFADPVIYQKVGNSQRVGDGIDQEAGDFSTMSQEWKGVVAFGTAVVDPHLTVGSNGTGT